MFLTGLTHRRRLFDIAMRWLMDDPHPDDGRVITEIFVYEGLLSVYAAQQFMDEVYEQVFGERLALEPIHYKHELREMALQAIGTPTPRHYEMMECYHSNPEAFFRRMPIDGVMGFTGDARLVGTFRLKRPRRVAEKTSRRIADYLGRTIRERAETAAIGRAESQGIPLDELVSTPEQKRRDFTDAESKLSDQFRERRMRMPAEALNIDDMIGFKLIGRPDELARAVRAIEEHPQASIYEREVHTGDYNAMNILVDLALPEPAELMRRFRSEDWRFAAGRGLSPAQLAKGFPAYVKAGAGSVRVELILTSFDELLESELGRCIHEYRVLEQRYNRDYRGRMSKNAEFIIEYLLAVAFGPTTDVGEIPCKMWGQYLPETLSSATREVYGQLPSGLVLPSIAYR
jgi:hypothetical protein